MVWQLQSAKQKFSELVDRALSEGPQVVTRRGREVVVVIGMDEYERLRKRKRDFKRALLEGPPYFDEVEIERSSEPARRVEL